MIDFSQHPLYFLAIPKTASTSLYHLIERYFPTGKAMPQMELHHFLACPDEVLASYDFVAGHFFYNVAPLLGREPIYITMLRDPVARTLSAYHHYRREGVVPESAWVSEQGFQEFISDPRNDYLWVNLQVRQLGLCRDLLSAHQAALASAQADGNPNSASTLALLLRRYAPDGWHEPGILATARLRLNEFPWVGITEHFDASVRLLCQRFDWPEPDAVPRLNVTSATSPVPITPEVREIVEQGTWLDRELYCEFRQKLETELEGEGRDRV